MDDGVSTPGRDGPNGVELRPRGRRAAPTSPAIGLVAPLLPFLATSVAWVARHRLAAGLAVTGLATVAMLAGGIALMQPSGDAAADQEASTSVDDPRPTSTRPTAPSPYGPVLPTPAPPLSPPAETTPPVEGDDEAPVDDPVTEPTAAPEPDDDHPGQGKGPKKPK